jgi:hypothetical protein
MFTVIYRPPVPAATAVLVLVSHACLPRRSPFVIRQAILKHGRVGDTRRSIDINDPHALEKVGQSGSSHFQFLAPKKPQHGEKRHQGQSKEEGTTATMNHAVDHVRTDVYAKQRDDQNTHRVSEKP